MGAKNRSQVRRTRIPRARTVRSQECKGECVGVEDGVEDVRLGRRGSGTFARRFGDGAALRTTVWLRRGVVGGVGRR